MFRLCSIEDSEQHSTVQGTSGKDGEEKKEELEEEEEHCTV